MAFDTPSPNTDLPSYRQSQTCFMRGYAETVKLNLQDGNPWEWRRICFTMKGAALLNAASASDGIRVQLDPMGYTRPVSPITLNLRTVLHNLIFKGDVARDWSSPFTAKLDTQRITVKYDKTMTLNPGNPEGMIRNFKMWHPMNANLVYQDDESGTDIIKNEFSTLGKAGMGDFYVYDMFVAGGSPAADLLIQMGATLYWHEK
jgi:hypothetical protein